MKPRILFHLLPALLGAVFISSCATTTQVDPAARSVLTQTTDKLRAANTIHVTGTRVADPALLPSGSTREFVKFDLDMVRPGTLSVRSSDKEGSRHLLAGAGKITLYDEKANVYSTVETKADNIDDLVDEIEAKFDTKMSVSELLSADPMPSLMDGVIAAKVVGDENVGNTSCTHLAFTQKDLYWELWIAKSDSLPRMISFTYLDKPGKPKRVTSISRWRLDGSVSDSAFAIRPKKGAQEVEVIH